MSPKAIDRQIAVRSALLYTRASNLELQAKLALLQAEQLRETATTLLHKHGVVDGQRVIVDEGELYPVGTVLTADGQPVPATEQETEER